MDKNKVTFHFNVEEQEKSKRFGFRRIKDSSYKYKSENIISEIKKKVWLTKHTEVNNGASNEVILTVDTKRMLESLCERPSGLTEVRRDGKDNATIFRVIQQEFKRCEESGESGDDLCKHMQSFASACWVSNIVFFQYYNHANDDKTSFIRIITYL
jgi:hypothetical protein